MTLLVDRHGYREVGYAVMHLAVTGGIVERQGRFNLPEVEPVAY